MDVMDEVFAEFEPRGFFVGETEDEPAPASTTETVDDESADDEPAEDVKRPAKTAPVDAWRKYAESLGVEVKGLSKQEIIAATK